MIPPKTSTVNMNKGKFFFHRNSVVDSTVAMHGFTRLFTGQCYKNNIFDVIDYRRRFGSQILLLFYYLIDKWRHTPISNGNKLCDRLPLSIR